MTRIMFYLRYAARNLSRSGRWTAFAVFCIAAGVATVVALRGLGLAIGDSLTNNLRTTNHGDISLYAGDSFGGFGFGEAGDTSTFSASALQEVETWARENNARITAYTSSNGLQVTEVDAVSVGRPQFVTSLLIDPETFPPTDDIFALEPAGVPVGELFTQPNSIIVSDNLAQSQDIQVGDTVRVSGTTEAFTVTGIVSTDAEASLTTNPFIGLFGFVYLNNAAAKSLNSPTLPTAISVALPEGASFERIESAARELRALTGADEITTVPELLERNEMVADIIGRFIVVMGLGALLIGGVGIINTMLVIVGRRTFEIAALKTFGLKGRQVALLFLAEAFLLGVMGSIVGSILGVLLGGVVNAYGEAFINQSLRFRVYPEAILFGLALGVVVTLVFGILPILTANRVRPATILRPNEASIPRASIFHSLVALALVVIVIGGAAGQILGSVPIGMIGVGITLIMLGILVGVMWLIVWLVSKLPTFGNVDFRLALRNLSARRIRTATTLLALSAGMFALSSITLVGAGTREILNFQLSQTLGGNVLVFPFVSLVSENIGEGLLNAQLSDIEGIEYRTRLSTYEAQVQTVDGEVPTFSFPGSDQMPARAQRAMRSVGLQVRDTDNPDLSYGTIVAGRALTPEDTGQPVILIPQADDAFDTSPFGDAGVGSIIEIESGNRTYDLEVVGVYSSGGAMNFTGGSGAYIPADVIAGSPGFGFTILQVAPENLNQVLLDLSANPLLFSLDISYIDSLLKRLIDQFAAIPTVVGLLSLLAAAVAMANTVSLATLERRRQIGILKAVGLKGRRVLWVMLLENTLIGLLGGLLGIGISVLGVTLMTQLSTGVPIPVPAESRVFIIGLIVASVVIAWVSTFLSARVAIRERVANVLRYE